MGDLKYGRTVHSLAAALTEFDANQHFISRVAAAAAPVRFDLHETGAQVREHTDLEGVLGELDDAVRHPDPEGTVPGRKRVPPRRRRVPDRRRDARRCARRPHRDAPASPRRRDRARRRRDRSRDVLRAGAQRDPGADGAATTSSRTPRATRGWRWTDERPRAARLEDPRRHRDRPRRGRAGAQRTRDLGHRRLRGVRRLGRDERPLGPDSAARTS